MRWLIYKPVLVIKYMVVEKFLGFLGDTSAPNPFLRSFRSGFGNKMALIAPVDNLHLTLDRGHSSLLILLDFDTIGHYLYPSME